LVGKTLSHLVLLQHLAIDFDAEAGPGRHPDDPLLLLDRLLRQVIAQRVGAITYLSVSREFDEAGVKRDRRWLEELHEREHVRNRPTRLLRPIRLRRIADGNEECRDLIIAETKLT
jgi:hypothetical protein